MVCRSVNLMNKLTDVALRPSLPLLALRASTTVAVMLLGCLCSSATARSAEPLLEKVDVFTARDGDYYHYRVPGIIVTAKGTVLAYCEARKEHGDWANIDLVLRRSEDGGRTWGERQLLVESSQYKALRNPAADKKRPADRLTCNNIVMIADRAGPVHCLFCVEYGHVFYMRSDDDGRTFSKPRDITETLAALRSQYNWHVIATGPGHGLQLKSGRLLVPVWMSDSTGRNPHHPSAITTLYSDDDGASWKAGEIAADTTPAIEDPNETTAVELSDGRVLLNVRNQAEEKQRAICTSSDGASGWSQLKLDEALYDPTCMGSLVRLTSGSGEQDNRILFSNADSRDFQGERRLPNGRQNLSIKLSRDDCRTWPVNQVLEPGISGYSDLAALPDGTALCIYERETNDKKRGAGDPGRLTVARFNLAWLTGGKDAEPSSP